MQHKFFNWRNLKFNISDQNVYPPKPASLLLADACIKIIKPEEKILDMCTGCGIVAIATAKFVPNTKIFASDINPKAIYLTKLNAKRNNVKLNASVGNLCKIFPDNNFDVITVHPPAVPYLPKMSWGMSNGMGIATNGGPDGSRLVVISIYEAKRCLKKNGKLLLLLPHWSNFKKSYKFLQKNYSAVSEIARKKVLFFPSIEGKPNKNVLQHFYKLAKRKIIEIDFKNSLPYSNVSVIEAIK